MLQSNTKRINLSNTFHGIQIVALHAKWSKHLSWFKHLDEREEYLLLFHPIYPKKKKIKTKISVVWLKTMFLGGIIEEKVSLRKYKD